MNPRTLLLFAAALHLLWWAPCMGSESPVSPELLWSFDTGG